jgi:hypothetical protein
MSCTTTYVNVAGAQWAWAQQVRTQLQGYLLQAFGQHANCQGISYPTINRLAEMVHANERSVRRTIDQLVEMGLLRILVSGQGRRTASTYQIVGFTSRPVKTDSDDRTDWTRTTFAPVTESYESIKEINKKEKESARPIFEADPDCATAPPPASPAAPPKSSFVHEGPVDPSDGQGARPAPVDATTAPIAEPSLPGVEPPPPAPRMPSPAEIIEVWNREIAGSPLIPMVGTPTRGECIMLQQAMKHTSIENKLDRWARCCRWAAKDPFFRGDRRGGYPASIRQIATSENISRWWASLPLKTLANVSEERLRQLDLYALIRDNYANLVDLSRNPAILVDIPPGIDPLHCSDFSMVKITFVSDQNAALKEAWGYDPSKPGSFMWQAVERDPVLRAEIFGASARSDDFAGQQVGKTPDPLYGQNNGHSGNAGDPPPDWAGSEF